MTAEIINLRQARKRRARDLKDAQAAENRARFGRTRSEREREELTQARAARTLDGHQRDEPVTIGNSAPSPGPEEDNSVPPLKPQSPPRSSR
jgi:uncharacterized protein YdaU (DUF1376 family)